MQKDLERQLDIFSDMQQTLHGLVQNLDEYNPNQGYNKILFEKLNHIPQIYEKVCNLQENLIPKAIHFNNYEEIQHGIKKLGKKFYLIFFFIHFYCNK